MGAAILVAGFSTSTIDARTTGVRYTALNVNLPIEVANMFQMLV